MAEDSRWAVPDQDRNAIRVEPGPAGLDLSRPLRIHVVGIGGSGMSAIATVLSAMGHQVTGSDLKSSAGLERLAALGVRTQVGHDAGIVHDAELLTISTAIPASNVEVIAATQRGLPVLRRAEMLAAICATRPTLAVAGTHGKTTTSSMLALMLVEAGLHPSFIIGGDINEVGAGAVWSEEGRWLVVEADESDGTFLELAPQGVVVTSVEPDHLDFYGDAPHMEAAFATFVAAAPGPRIICADDPGAARLLTAGGPGAPIETYGTSGGADYHMAHLMLGRSSVAFDVSYRNRPLGRISLAVPGLYNARNACGALAMALAAGADFAACGRALRRYGGVARRFEFRGEQAGVTYVDDYGHLPGEVKAVLAAARDGGWRRVIAVFQPHRYSRTAALWADFADAFVDADRLIVTDIYAAGEAPRPGVTGKLIIDAVGAAHPDAAISYMPGRHELMAELRATLEPGDLCLTLGAGDLTAVPGELLGQTG